MSQDPTEDRKSSQWEQDLLQRFAFEALREQRATRRWGIFFKLLVLVYLLALVVASVGLSHGGHLGGLSSSGRITAVVKLHGVIAPDLPGSADTVIEGLRAAFDDKRTAAVIIQINSPGGSPVQAGYINDEIYRLKQLHPKTKVYAVIEDICASGAYYVAAAADEVYADKGSLVGSIGVRIDGFGFVEALDKLGIERRLLTAGDHKGFLDPFSAIKPDEVVHVQGLLKEIHQQFINTVLKGRRDRLKAGAELFNGLIWTGERSLELGLVDSLGSTDFVAREIVKASDTVDFTPQQSVLEQVGRRLGTQFAATAREALRMGW